MREIKFKYYYSTGIDLATSEVISKVFDMDSDIANGEHWDYICDDPIMRSFKILDRMQYTGLKDKNGTEIYEGDIVKAYHREWEEYTTSHVKFCDGAFSLGRYWKDGIHSWYSIEQYESSDLEVIGNIYENPELLEDN